MSNNMWFLGLQAFVGMPFNVKPSDFVWVLLEFDDKYTFSG